MKVKLEENKLGTILKETVSQIIKKYNVLRRGKRAAWYMKILQSLEKYKQKLSENLIPALVKDFGGTVSVKVVGGKMSQEEVTKLKEFKEMLEKTDDNKYKDDMKKEIKEALEGHLDVNVEDMMDTVDDCHDIFQEEVDMYIRETILGSVFKETKERSKLETTIYNFTEKDVPEEVKKLFKHGVDSVPEIGLSIHDIKKRVNDALIQYLESYKSRRNFGMNNIEEEEVTKWLDRAIQDEVDSHDREFYKRTREGILGLMSELQVTYNETKIDTEQQIKKKLEIEGSVIVLCDKGLGMCLFSLSTMRDADKKLMEQMGAQKVQENENEVITEVFMRIREFEKDLDDEQRE